MLQGSRTGALLKKSQGEKAIKSYLKYATAPAKMSILRMPGIFL